MISAFVWLVLRPAGRPGVAWFPVFGALAGAAAYGITLLFENPLAAIAASGFWTLLWRDYRRAPWWSLITCLTMLTLDRPALVAAPALARSAHAALAWTVRPLDRHCTTLARTLSSAQAVAAIALGAASAMLLGIGGLIAIAGTVIVVIAAHWYAQERRGGLTEGIASASVRVTECWVLALAGVLPS